MISNEKAVLDKIIALIDDEYDSDAAFERELGLNPKTVNNWRRGRSSSYMRMLPTLADCFGVSVGGLLDMPVSSDASELSEDEIMLLDLYRSASSLTREEKDALKETLCDLIHLYVSTHAKTKSRTKKAKK